MFIYLLIFLGPDTLFSLITCGTFLVLLVNSLLFNNVVTVLGHVIKPHQDIDRLDFVFRVMGSNEFQLLGQKDDLIPGFVHLINEKLLWLSMAGIICWLIFFQFLGLFLLGNFLFKSWLVKTRGGWLFAFMDISI